MAYDYKSQTAWGGGGVKGRTSSIPQGEDHLLVLHQHGGFVIVEHFEQEQEREPLGWSKRSSAQEKLREVPVGT